LFKLQLGICLKAPCEKALKAPTVRYRCLVDITRSCSCAWCYLHCCWPCC